MTRQQPLRTITLAAITALTLSGCAKRVLIAEYPVKQALDGHARECASQTDRAEPVAAYCEPKCAAICESPFAYRDHASCSEEKRQASSSSSAQMRQTISPSVVRDCVKKECRDVCNTECSIDYQDNRKRNVRYWSAYAYVDPENIQSAWDSKNLSQIFVSAEIKIPTRDEPLVRDFPLFSASGGSIQTHLGVDLLQKLPIMVEAREQVSVTLKVKYLKNFRAMEIARKIVSVSEGLANAILDNYPAASQVLTSATGTIDELMQDQRDQPANALTQAIVPERLYRRGERPMVMAFMLRTGIENEMEDNAEPARFADGLTPCTDQPFALCKTTLESPVSEQNCYQKNAISEPYVTLTFRGYPEVYDPLLLLPGDEHSCELLDEVGIDRVRTHLNQNRDLFHPDDAAKVEANISAAERYLAARDAVESGDVLRILELLNRSESSRDDPCAQSPQGAYFKVWEPEEPKVDRLCTDGRDLDVCDITLWERSLPNEIWNAWDSLNAECYGEYDASCEVDSLGDGLSRLLALTGHAKLDLTRELSAEDLEKLEKGVFQRSLVLYHYFLRLGDGRRRLLAQVRNLDATPTDDPDVCAERVKNAGDLVSDYCAECLEEIDKRLKSCKQDWRGALALAEQRVNSIDSEVEEGGGGDAEE